MGASFIRAWSWRRVVCFRKLRRGTSDSKEALAGTIKGWLIPVCFKEGGNNEMFPHEERPDIF